MCRSQDQGGQRCHAHTAQALAGVEREAAAALADHLALAAQAEQESAAGEDAARLQGVRVAAARRLAAVQEVLVLARVEHASTLQGAAEMVERAERTEARAGWRETTPVERARLLREAQELRDQVAAGHALRRENQRAAATARRPVAGVR